MNSYNDFKDSRIYEVNDFASAIEKARELRAVSEEELYTIKIKSSISKGRFKFPFSNFCLIGEENTIITCSHYGKERNPSTLIDRTTWQTSSLTVTGNNNIFVNIKIENTAMYPEKKGTSVALSIFGDENLFINCSINSSQDTLFLGPLPEDLSTRYIGFIPEDEYLIEGTLRNYFLNCLISGSVDFIFGAGQGIFKNCTIESIEDGRMGLSYVTAPAHPLSDDFGFLFYSCQFISKSIFCQRVYLGRPWRDYGKCVFINCDYGNHIKEEGFCDWSSQSFRYRTARFLEFPLQKGRVEWISNNKVPSSSINKYLDVIKKL